MKHSTPMFRPLAVASLLLAAGFLSGCTREELALETEYVPYSGSEQYPIVVERGPTTMQVANNGSLTASQINAISHFGRQAAGAAITVSKPSAASTRQSHEIANLLAQQGVATGKIRMASYQGSKGGPVKITVTKPVAHTNPCGEWPEDLTETRMNHMSYNHGCAVQTNIAAMVANPEDFENPQPIDPATAASRLSGINAIDGTGGSGAATTSSGSSGSSGSITGGGTTAP